MQDKQYAILWKENFNNFISSLSKLHKLAAPVFKGYNNYAFENVRSGQEIALKYIPTILPPKKFFMPVHETLLEYGIFRTSPGSELSYPQAKYQDHRS
jgi:sulfhydrogenase subunit beta (sulfur reductase)